MPSILQVRNLGFQRAGRWLFRELNFDLQAGEFVALVGPSGVGKTTLLSCLAGVLEPSEGSIEWSLSGYSNACPIQVRHRFGIIFQDLQLSPNADLLTNVMCGRLARLSSWRTLFGFPQDYKIEAYRLLHELGIGQAPYKWVSEMSGGEQQRVAIARALFQEPDVYFADEPVSNLDTYYAGRVLGILRQEAQEKQRAVFCVLHNADLIQRFADIALSLNSQHPGVCKVRRIRESASIPSAS